MKRKLKTLKQLVDEFPGLYFLGDGSLVICKGCETLNKEILHLLGREIEVDCDGFLHLNHHLYVIDEWILEPLPKQEEWFEVICHHKNNKNPCAEPILYRSIFDYLNSMEAKESDFHWIKLRKVDL